MKNPFISIIIVNFNGKKWLEKCLTSIYSQSYINFEVIFVDNGSNDGSIEFVKNNFPKTLIIENKTNLGFAEGNNTGCKKAKGEYILLINNDTYAEKNFIKNFIEAFNKIPNLACAQSKIVLMGNPEKLDMVGAYWTDLAFLYYYGYGKNANSSKYNKPMPFFSNKGASMLIKKEVIDKIGLFDEDFINYYEETDFCHRAWIAGYECWYWPKAILFHATGGTSKMFDNSYIQYHNFKNKLDSFLKNFEFKSLVTIIPIYLIINFFLSMFWLFQGKYKHFLALYKAIYWDIKNTKKIFMKRKAIQAFRKKSDYEISKKTKVNPKFNYYLHLLTGKIENYSEKDEK